MRPILVISGATCTGKTALAVSLAKATGAVVVPLDQLQMYQYLKEGVGLESSLLAEVTTDGYSILSPWQVFPPCAYVDWLERIVTTHAVTKPVIIEGGCTSYFQMLLARASTGSILSHAVIIALDIGDVTPVDLHTRIEQSCSEEKFDRIVKETELLSGMGFIKKDGLNFLLQCESLFVHPEHQDTTLAWAVRISAKVYYPAYSALLGLLPRSDARERLIRNAIDIHSYQRRRIRALLANAKIGHLVACQELEEWKTRLQVYITDNDTPDGGTPKAYVASIP